MQKGSKTAIAQEEKNRKESCSARGFDTCTWADFVSVPKLELELDQSNLEDLAVPSSYIDEHVAF